MAADQKIVDLLGSHRMPIRRIASGGNGEQQSPARMRQNQSRAGARWGANATKAVRYPPMT